MIVDPDATIADSPTSLLGVNHIGLSVKDLDTALSFYRRATGFELIDRGSVRNSSEAETLYGVRGIGSIYYLCYAGSHIEFVDEDSLWSLVALVILCSTLLHGFSVGWAMEQSSETRPARDG